MGVKNMSHVKYRRALVENLVGDMRNRRKRSHPRSAEREGRINIALHFLYHNEKEKQNWIVRSNQKVKEARKETYLYC
jgi:hypothetical protein